MIDNRYRVSFWGDENVLKLVVVMGVQLCQCSKNDLIVQFKNKQTRHIFHHSFNYYQLLS